MAAALVLGATVLDVGCGEAGLVRHLAPSVRYSGLDRTITGRDGAFRNGDELISADAVRFLSSPGHQWDTVVCLEFIEHIDPAHQALLVHWLWERCDRRLIISSPDPDALRRYPQTDHFYGVGNPHHTREVSHHWLRKMVAACRGVYDIQVFEHGLDADDLPTWGHGPAAGWMAVVDRA